MQHFIKYALLARLFAGAVSTIQITPAQSAGIQLGLLISCTVEGGFGLLVGSSRDMTCSFNPVSPDAKKGSYVGTINKLGIDIGVTNKSYIKWAVVAAEGYVRAPGQLAGTYSGASASATFAVVFGAICHGLRSLGRRCRIWKQRVKIQSRRRSRCSTESG